MERRLAAIFALDMVGYSRLMEGDEADTLARQKTYRADLIDPSIANHHGRVVKGTGDGLLAEFASAVDAVECAVEIQRAMPDLEKDVPAERRIQFRIGINVGDIVAAEDGDIYGDGVNVAARVESLADPGRILVSASAYGQVHNKVQFGFEDLGLHPVKNLAQPVHVFRVDPDSPAAETTPVRRSLKQRKIVQWSVAYFAAAWLSLELFDLVAEQFMWPIWVRQGATVFLLFGLLITLVLAWHHGERGRQKATVGELALIVSLLALAGTSVWILRSRDEMRVNQSSVASFALRRAPLPEHSVAVLPCANLSGDSAHEYFADGLASELITRLSAVSELRVPSQTSSFTFKGRVVPVEEVAAVLRVRNVLECGVTVEGTNLRVSTRLVDAETGYATWSQVYDRGTEGLLDVQKDIALSVVGRLEIELRSGEALQLARRWTEQPEAYDHFLRGIQYQVRSPTPSNVRTAKQHFERAIEIDPEFGRAHARLAVQWVVLGNFLYLPAEEAYPEAQRVAARALELDEELWEAYWALGWVDLAFLYTWHEAMQHFERTIALAPGEWGGYHSLGFVLGVLGRTEEALEAANIAFDLDPLAYWPSLGMLFAQKRRRDHEEVIQQAQRLVEMQPGSPFLMAELSMALVRSGRTSEAEAQMDEAEQIAPENSIIQLLVARVRAAAGDSSRALSMVEAVLEREGEGGVDSRAGDLAFIYAELGLGDEAMRWLRTARRNNDLTMLFLDAPAFDSLRDDDRFAAFVRELDLPEDIYLRPLI